MLVTHVPAQYWIGYGIFFSALIISIRTDLDQMLISRYVTLMLIPLGLALSAMKAIEISPTESALGVVVGYAVPYFIARIFYACTHKEGLGEGDMELLSFIGAFTGIYGCWITLLIGSLVGSVIGAGYIIAKGQPAQSRIPFGPFLALGAIAYILYQPTLTSFIWGLSI
jgi:leader peptidase (prepilin peptidase)/N-methyltransferase